jgi:DNA end-binding protein Ku
LPASIWSGYIPVRLAVASEKKDLAFHLLHRKDGSRIRQRYFCAADDQALELEDLARGYESNKLGTHLLAEFGYHSACHCLGGFFAACNPIALNVG